MSASYRPGTILGAGATSVTEQQRFCSALTELTCKQGEAEHGYKQVQKRQAVEKNNEGGSKGEKDAILNRAGRAECSNK